VAAVHPLFDLMVGVGVLALLLPLLHGWRLWRQPPGAAPRWLLRFAVIMGPVAMLGSEAGWVFAELGRQPWTVVGVLTTAAAATRNPAAGALLLPFALLYALLVAGAAVAVGAHRRRHPLAPELAEVPAAVLPPPPR
jgi:cytochrome d ubiquinol oxidase subunit I